MTEEKKGFWARLKGSKKKASGCCSINIEEIPEDVPEETDVEVEEKETAKEKKAEPAPCCGGIPTPRRRGGGSGCCG
ncbi:MAG: hypothetical protein M0R80_07080 [Proteobacteria bacterium]|jgi:hypothetical protein|nr:hypothetical protein [Pseudomonadota bacterium]